MGRCHHINGAFDHACGPDPCVADANERDKQKQIGEGDCAGGVAPLHPGNLYAGEKDLFDCWVAESSLQSSIPVDYFALDKAIPKQALAQDENWRHRDAAALYGEPHTVPQHRGPFTLNGLVKKDSKSWETFEEGATITYDMTLEVPRTEFERAGLEAPREGDIVRFWKLPFYTRWAQPFRDSPPRSGFFFEITDTQGDKYPFGGPFFLMFTLKLKRNTLYPPERKLYGDAEPPYTVKEG